MFGKKKRLLALLLSTAIVMTGCGNGAQQGSSSGSNASSSEASSESTSTELKSVRIGGTAATGQLLENALLAQQLGYIDEELEKVGCQAEYIGFAGAGPAVNEAFAASEIDYAIYADFPLITARSNGVDVKAVGSVNQETHYALLVTEKSGIKKAADIKGKKIIVTPGTILYKYFSELCEENKISVDDVEIVNAMTDAQTVLASGDADGLIITYGAALMYESMGLGKVVADTTENPEQAAGIILAGRGKYIEENPDVTKALLQAFKRSADYAKENPDEVYQLMVTDASPEEILKKTYAYDTSFGYFMPDLSEEYMKRAESVYNFAKDNSLLGEEFDLNEAFDNSYAEEVMAEKAD